LFLYRIVNADLKFPLKPYVSAAAKDLILQVTFYVSDVYFISVIT
jgi:hypothetical protein